LLPEFLIKLIRHLPEIYFRHDCYLTFQTNVSEIYLKFISDTIVVLLLIFILIKQETLLLNRLKRSLFTVCGTGIVLSTILLKKLKKLE
jgi:hypothetical protein